MKRERCPRIIDPEVYKEKYKKIKFLSTRKSFQTLSLEKLFINVRKRQLIYKMFNSKAETLFYLKKN